MDEKRDYSEIQDNQKTKVQDFYAWWMFGVEWKKEFSEFENSVWLWFWTIQRWLWKVNSSLEKNNEIEKHKIKTISNFLCAISIMLFLILITLLQKLH